MWGWATSIRDGVLLEFDQGDSASFRYFSVPIAAIIAVAVAVFVLLSWLHWRRSGTYVAPGVGAIGGGTGMIAVGGVLVAKGHELPGLLLDLLGVIAIWAAFTAYSER